MCFLAYFIKSYRSVEQQKKTEKEPEQQQQVHICVARMRDD